jgi:hypothetical protein
MPIDMAHMDMPEDEQSQARPAAAAKKTKPAAKPGGGREDRLAEALRENLRRRKAAKQTQDKKE